MKSASTGRIRLREARPQDVDAVIALERATEFAPRWPRRAYAEALQSAFTEPRRQLIAAERVSDADEPLATHLVGFAVGARHSGSAELESVCVAAGERRAGIGLALCEAIVAWTRALGAAEIALEVRAASEGAIALYQRLGFVETARRPRYYIDPEDDAILMRLTLIPSPHAGTVGHLTDR